MYRLDEVKSIHLEVTTRCQAKCPACSRRINGGELTPGLELTEITIDNFKSWFDPDFISQLKHIYACGNNGDPMVSDHTLPIFEYIREINPTMKLEMHTNGSGRDSKFWQKLASLDVNVVFALDGLEDTHDYYRVNTDFNKILDNAQDFIAAGGDATWFMLVFKHNQHQVDDCKKMAKALGFNKFNYKHSVRFEMNEPVIGVDDNFNVIREIHPSDHARKEMNIARKFMVDFAAQEDFDSVPWENIGVDCEAKENSQIFVAADGTITPCSFIASLKEYPVHPRRVDYLSKMKQFYNLHHKSLNDIFDDNYFTDVEKLHEKGKLKICATTCTRGVDSCKLYSDALGES